MTDNNYLTSPILSDEEDDDEYEAHEHALAASISSIKRHSRGEHWGSSSFLSNHHNKSNTFPRRSHDFSPGVREEDIDDASLQSVEDEPDQLDTDIPGFGQMGVLQVSFNIINATIGSGVLGLPYAIRLAGFYSGIALSFWTSFLANMSLYMLIQAGRRVGVYKYAHLCEFAMGNTGFYLFNVLCLCESIGAGITYTIILGDSVPTLSRFLPWLAHRKVTTFLVTIIFVLPICLPRSISSLSRFSLLSVICIPIVILVVAIKAPQYADPNRHIELEIIGDRFWPAIGVMAFAFLSVHLGFLNYLTLERPTSSRWMQTTSLSVLVSLIISLTFAVIGYVSFGSDTPDNIFNAFPLDDTVVNIGRLVLAFTILMTFPMAFYPARAALQQTLGLETATKQPNNIQHYIVTFALFFAIVAVGVSVTNLGLTYSLIGVLCSTSIGYILPPAMYFYAFTYGPDPFTHKGVRRRSSTTINERTPLHSTSNSIRQRKLRHKESVVFETYHLENLDSGVKRSWWLDTSAALCFIFGLVAAVIGTVVTLSDFDHDSSGGRRG